MGSKRNMDRAFSKWKLAESEAQSARQKYENAQAVYQRVRGSLEIPVGEQVTAAAPPQTWKEKVHAMERNSESGAPLPAPTPPWTKVFKRAWHIYEGAKHIALMNCHDDAEASADRIIAAVNGKAELGDSPALPATPPACAWESAKEINERNRARNHVLQARDGSVDDVMTTKEMAEIILKHFGAEVGD